MSEEKVPRPSRSLRSTLDRVLVHDIKNMGFRLQMLLSNVDEHYGDPEFKRAVQELLQTTVERLDGMVERFSAHEDALLIKVGLDLNSVIREVVSGTTRREPDSTSGQPTPAVVRGFGIVFSDVDLADQTTIQLFRQDGSSLGTYSAPVRSDEGGFSFVGVTFADAIIARVRITLGTGALGANVEDVSAGGTVDLVVLDNLIYGEPRKAL